MQKSSSRVDSTFSINVTGPNPKPVSLIHKIVLLLFQDPL
jgi:hypothetical protein